MAITIAVLDANVLFPASLRDTLLRAAEQGVFQSLWNPEILEEMRRNLVKKKKMSEAQSRRLVQAINASFPYGHVSDVYTQLIDLMTNDPKDRHVLATAVQGKASSIVTFNLSDFPSIALDPSTITAIAPDEFLLKLFHEQSEAMKAVIREQVLMLHQPPMTLDEVLHILSAHAPRFCEAIGHSFNNPDESIV